MAYLKGNTYVDGDLYINGGLRVKKLIGPGGITLPYLDDMDSSEENHLVKFSAVDGGLSSSRISEEIDGDSVNYVFDGPGNTVNLEGTTLEISNASQIDFNIDISKIFTEDAEVVLLKKISSYDLIGNGQEYYFDGTSYYIPFDGATGFQNWPDAVCYESLMEIK